MCTRMHFQFLPWSHTEVTRTLRIHYLQKQKGSTQVSGMNNCLSSPPRKRQQIRRLQFAAPDEHLCSDRSCPLRQRGYLGLRHKNLTFTLVLSTLQVPHAGPSYAHTQAGPFLPWSQTISHGMLLQKPQFPSCQ